MEGFEEYKKKCYPYHYYSPIWENMMMSDHVEDAYAAGQIAAAKRCAEIIMELHKNTSNDPSRKNGLWDAQHEISIKFNLPKGDQ